MFRDIQYGVFDRTQLLQTLFREVCRHLVQVLFYGLFI